MCIQCVDGDDDEHVNEVAFEEPQWKSYWDDLTGRELRRDLVEAARAQELAVVKNMQAWRKVRRQECFQATGRPPIKLRCVNICKGDDLHPKYRSRIVPKEIKIDNPPSFSTRPRPWSLSSTSSQDAPVAKEGPGPADS